MLSTYQREPTLFEFSPETNKEGLKMKNDVTLQWLRCKGFRYYCLPMFTIKATLFPDNGLSQQKWNISCTN